MLPRKSKRRRSERTAADPAARLEESPSTDNHVSRQGEAATSLHTRRNALSSLNQTYSSQVYIPGSLHVGVTDDDATDESSPIPSALAPLQDSWPTYSPVDLAVGNNVGHGPFGAEFHMYPTYPSTPAPTPAPEFWFHPPSAQVGSHAQQQISTEPFFGSSYFPVPSQHTGPGHYTSIFSPTPENANFFNVNALPGTATSRPVTFSPVAGLTLAIPSVRSQPYISDLYSRRRRISTEHSSTRGSPLALEFTTDQGANLRSPVARSSVSEQSSVVGFIPPQPRHSCPVCNKQIKTASNLTAHTRNVHGDSSERQYVCKVPHCGKSFGRQTDLDRHCSGVHEKSKKWQCGSCGCGFPRKDSRDRHEKNRCKGAYAWRQNRRFVSQTSSFASMTSSFAISPALSGSPYYYETDTNDNAGEGPSNWRRRSTLEQAEIAVKREEEDHSDDEVEASDSSDDDDDEEEDADVEEDEGE